MATRRHLRLVFCVAALLVPAARAAHADPISFGASAEAVFAFGHPNVGGGGQFAASTGFHTIAGSSIFASSSLSDGSLHSFSAGAAQAGCGAVFQCPGGRSIATFWDTLYIHNGQNAGLIDQWVDIDGVLDGPRSSARVRFYAGGQESNFWNHIDGYAPWQSLNTGTTTLNEDAMLLPQYGDTTVFVFVMLETAAAGSATASSVADFGHTLRFNWHLPEGATFTSASGHFLSEAAPATVPEPMTGVTVLTGLACFGFARQLRRRGSPIKS